MFVDKGSEAPDHRGKGFSGNKGRGPKRGGWGHKRSFGWFTDLTRPHPVPCHPQGDKGSLPAPGPARSVPQPKSKGSGSLKSAFLRCIKSMKLPWHMVSPTFFCHCNLPEFPLIGVLTLLSRAPESHSPTWSHWGTQISWDWFVLTES